MTHITRPADPPVPNRTENDGTITNDGRPILFFDGVCGLCNGFVDFAMPRDANKRLRFAPLQGETAEQLLTEKDRQLDTVVLWTPRGIHKRSFAVIATLSSLGRFWSTVGFILWLVPSVLRDFGYRVVASLRYRLFGRKDSCRLPTPEEAGRILP